MILRKLCCSMLALLALCASTNAAQEKPKPRDLNRYAIGDRFELTWGLTPVGLEKVRQKARDYLWEQWRQKRLTYFLVADCVIYPEGCHDSVEYKIYVEPDEKGRWLIVIEPERVVSAWMGGTDKEERTQYTRSVYSGLKRLAAGEAGNCYSLVTERSEEPAQSSRLHLISDARGTNHPPGFCFYF